MRTEFNRENADFSTRAHIAARRLVYPQVFGVTEDRLEFEDTLLNSGTDRKSILDGEMGVDRIVRVSMETAADPLRSALQFSVQERFRREKYYHSEYAPDVTITEWNERSDLPSELHKITAGLFVYGFYSEHDDDFLAWWCIDVVRLLMNLTHERVTYTRHTNKKLQTFVAFDVRRLTRLKCVLSEKASATRMVKAS